MFKYSLIELKRAWSLYVLTAIRSAGPRAKTRVMATRSSAAHDSARTDCCGAKRCTVVTDALGCNEQSSLLVLANDTLLHIVSVLGDSELAEVACVSQHMRTLATDEQAARQREAARVDAERRRAKRVDHRLAVARLAQYADDAHLISAVLKHILLRAPSEYSFVDVKGRKKLFTPPSGVCRVRVGIRADGEIFVGDDQQAERTVDALAVAGAALRKIVFLDQALGTVGAASAARQAKTLGLVLPANQRIHGRAFKIFVRGDVMCAMLASSPTLAGMLTS